MGSGALLTAGLTAAAISIALPPHASGRLRTLVAKSPQHLGAKVGEPGRRWAALSRRLRSRWGAAALVGVCLAMLIGGLAGLGLGVVAAVGLGWALGRLEPAATARRRERLSAELPGALDLLAACLAAGLPPGESLTAVTAALGGPVAEELAVVSTRLSLGADPASVWTAVAAHPVLGSLGRTMVRAVETGAPVAAGLERLVEDQRRASRWDAEQKARSVGVKAAAPLALCFLPAFVAVGIVPTIASAFTQIIG